MNECPICDQEFEGMHLCEEAPEPEVNIHVPDEYRERVIEFYGDN